MPRLSDMSRKRDWSRLGSEVFDVAIVGAGVNGAVAAAAMSAAGLQVALLDKSDFAAGTSQESSNLVWGGIKYLESYEFSLVWNLCHSRNELMQRYPSEIAELRFFTTLERGFRKPRFLVYLGSLLYWFMGRLRTKAPKLLNIDDIQREEPLIDTSRSQGGLVYSDCYLKDNDARFVFNFIRRARRQGAVALNYVEALSMSLDSGKQWQINLLDRPSQKTQSLRAKVVINAAGPYADAFNQACRIKTRHQHIFSKGVHLLVPRLNQSERVLTFFADDGRLFFAIPMGSCSCIGTTDTRVTDLPARVTREDRQFILDNINKRLRLPKPLTESDIIAERCGVRPLVIKGQAHQFEHEEWINLSRKHVIEVQADIPHISIFGGKLTDCLNIGRELLAIVEGLGLTPVQTEQWFGEDALEHRQAFESLAMQIGLQNQAWLGEGTSYERLWRLYGQDALGICQRIQAEPALSESVVQGYPVLLAEVAHMAEHEMVETIDDFLRRRSRLALVVPQQQLRESEGLRKAAQILFGDKADAKLAEYFKPIH